MACYGIVEKLSLRGRFLTVRCSDGSFAVFRAAAPAPASPGDIVEWQKGELPIVLRNLTQDGRPIKVDGARCSLPEAAASALVAILAGHVAAGFSRT